MSNPSSKRRNILLISPERWAHIFVSKHHYARELARRGHTVFFLQPPSEQFNINKVEDLLSVVNYKPHFRGVGKLPSFVSAYIIKWEIEKLEKQVKVQFDAIWNFDSSRFFNLARLEEKLRICHLVDMSENFQRPLLAKTADICFCTSDFIAYELKKYNLKVHKIHHGYTIPKKRCEERGLVDISASKQIKVGYIGNLSISFLDWQLIHQVVSENRSIGFYFIGGISPHSIGLKDKKYLNIIKKMDNTYFLGQKSAEQIPSYLACFDANLVCYKAKLYPAQVSSPHKFMEYFGSGKVIISTYTDEYKDKRHLLEMVDDASAFARTFNTVIHQLAHFNSATKQKERINFSRVNSYSNQMDRISRLINKTNNFIL